jgi:alpha-mannosidase
VTFITPRTRHLSKGGCMSRTVFVVPHTHWDREWYQPHELFRWRLVQMVDELLDLLERDPAFRCFTLDGQTVVIEDYLELRPEQEERLRALVQAGRLTIGPWWVQPDEFLPSGESHIRSLLRGIRTAERFGGSMRVGHCADQFGHIAQMPQIMAGLGLTSACLWRGVPDSVPGWSFWWEAPDGTRLPVLYLRHSYSNGWRLPTDPDELLARARVAEEGHAPHEPLLLMNGTDHARAQTNLPAVLAAAGGRGYDFRIASLPEYEAALLAAGVDEHVHRGELRSPDRSNVLAGVLSARLTIKQRDFAVSATLERYAEPLELLAHLHAGYDGLPALQHAWRLLLENSPHDSICGCSVDQTHREMVPRYDRAEQLAQQVAREAVAALAAHTAVPRGGGVLLFRPVPHAALPLECWVPASWRAPALRLPDGRRVPVALGPPARRGRAVEGGDVLEAGDTTPEGALHYLDFLRDGRVADRYVQSIRVTRRGPALIVDTVVGDGVAIVDEEAARRAARRIVRSGRVNTARITVREAFRRRLRAVLPPADTIGLELLLPAEEAPAQESDIRREPDGIANHFFAVHWRNGRLLVRDLVHGLELDGVNTFVSEGDRGDEYNADILDDAVVAPCRSRLLAIETDAVSAHLSYEVELDVPAALTADRTRRTAGRRVRLPIHTTVTLWSGVPRVDFTVSLDNRARDHRLRVLVPLPFRVTTVCTENQFHVAERSVTPPAWNGRSAEQPPATFPQKSFAAVEADGLGVAVFNRGLPEGEIVAFAGRQAYALTLLRCVGWLSRADLRSRRGHAGPALRTPDAQMPGPHTFTYALTTYRGTWRDAALVHRAHAFAYPPLAFATNAHPSLTLAVRHPAGDEGRAGRWPLVTLPDTALIPSAAYRSAADGAPLLRLFSAAAAPLRARLRVSPALGAAWLADLRERPHTALVARDGAWQVDIRPWQIVTLRFGG